MNKQFCSDYYRMTGEKYRLGIKSLVQIVFSHQIRYVYWWRKSHKKKNILHRYSKRYGLEISTEAEIGDGVYLGHAYNITVNGEAIIGKNVNLHKGCTIGKENRGRRQGAPIIGDCVSIGINASVVGNVKIGHDVMIAPNSFVNFDVPDHSVVIGNPGVIHRKEHATKGYVGFCI